MNKTKKIISISVIVALFGVTLSSYYQLVEGKDYEGNEAYWTQYCSGVISDATKRQQCLDYQVYIEDQIANSNQSASDLASSIDKVKGDLSNLKEVSLQYADKIAAFEADIVAIEQSLVAIQDSLAIVENDIVEKEENIKKRSDHIAERMVQMQAKINTNQFIDFIMGATDLIDLVQRSNGVESLTRSDKDQIKMLNEEKQKLEESKAEKKRMEDTALLQQDNLMVQKENLNQMKIANDQMVEKYEVKVAELLKARNEANAAANTLAQLKPSFSISNGNADIGDTNSSGMIDPIQGSWISRGVDNDGHRGVDYAAGSGTPIVAPADCYVVFASNSYPNVGWLGNMIGIPAGGGNSVRIIFNVNGQTYAVNFHHMQNNVPAMQWNGSGTVVSQGTVLGYVGSSGNSSGPHAHVEMFTLVGSVQQEVARWYSTGDWQSSCGWGLYTPAGGSYGNRVDPQQYF